MDEPRDCEKIEVGYDGTIYAGSYYVEDGWIFVSSEYGSKNVALRASPPRLYAKILMREILNAAARHQRT